MSKFGLKWENITLQCEVTHASVSYARAKNLPDTPQDKHLSWRGTFQLKNAPDFSYSDWPTAFFQAFINFQTGHAFINISDSDTLVN